MNLRMLLTLVLAFCMAAVAAVPAGLCANGPGSKKVECACCEVAHSAVATCCELSYSPTTPPDRVAGVEMSVSVAPALAVVGAPLVLRVDSGFTLRLEAARRPTPARLAVTCIRLV